MNRRFFLREITGCTVAAVAAPFMPSSVPTAMKIPCKHTWLIANIDYSTKTVFLEKIPHHTFRRMTAVKFTVAGSGSHGFIKNLEILE